MRHGIVGQRFGRNSSWRKATVRDIAKATLVRQRICTTKVKAKVARKLVDKLITLGKKGELAHKRRAFAIIQDHRLVKELFDNMAPRFRERHGGYTRIIPLSYRRGDNAQLAYLELTEKSQVQVTKSRSAATAKTKDLKAIPEKEKGAKQEKADKTIDSLPVQPKKLESKKHVPIHDKNKPGKKIIGGIKKIFRRKQTD
jgi:large subunit ribosomal protein L17